MFFRAFKSFATVLISVLLLVACGGESAPAPTGVSAKAGESTMTVSWDMVSGVEYWLFYGPTSVAPTDTLSMHSWIDLAGGGQYIKVVSPYVVSGLINGTSYSLSINGRIDGGPGGPGSTPVSSTPRIAGEIWRAGATNPPGSTDLRGVAYGAGYVAAGSGGAMYSSTDGESWSAINYATTSNLNGANYNGNYQLVGDNGLMLSSADAVTWTQQTTGTSQNLYAIASNGSNLTVAVGANGTILSSPDGIAWTPATSSATTSALYGVAYSTYNGGTWVAVGAGGTIVQSPDGLAWHAVTANTGADLRGIAFGASTSATDATVFVAIGAAGTVLSSTDAVTWTPQVLTVASTDLNAVTYGTQFVTAGSGGNIFISTDGVTWRSSSFTGTTNALYAVARGSLAYAAVGAAGTNLLSK